MKFGVRLLIFLYILFIYYLIDIELRILAKIDIDFFRELKQVQMLSKILIVNSFINRARFW